MVSNGESPLSISDDDMEHELNIKPPQAKVRKLHSRHPNKHTSSSRQVYVSSRHSRHKSHQSRHEVHPKRYDDRSDHDEYRRKRSRENREVVPTQLSNKVRKNYHEENSHDKHKMSERSKETDLRETLIRKHRHRVEKELNVEKVRHQKSEKRSAVKEQHKHIEEKKKRHHHKDDRKYERYCEDNRRDEIEPEIRLSKSHPHTPERHYSSRDSVIDVEVSPHIMKDETRVKDLEEGEVEKESSGNSSGTNNSSASSVDSDSDSSSTSNDSDDSTDESSSSEDLSSEHDVKSASKKVETTKKVENDVEMQEKPDNTPSKTNKQDDNNKSETEMDEESPAVSTDVSSEPESEMNNLPNYYPAIQGCRSVEEFSCINRIAEGTYGVVYRAREKRTNDIVALKRLKMEKEKEGFPITSLREINTLLKAQHPNIVTVREIVVGSNMDKIYIVMDYVEHDLKSLMETMKQKKIDGFTTGEVKCLMEQLLSAVKHLHDNWILHRDLKTSNLLFSHNGVLKVGDFGLAREYGSPIKQYTPIVVTLWYRAPELLLGSKVYSTTIDIWSVGCIFAEILRLDPLFPGKNEIDQIKKIFRVFGTPTEEQWPGYSSLPISSSVEIPQFAATGLHEKFKPKTLTPQGFDLLSKLLLFDTKKRLTAEEALKHAYFAENPVAINPTEFRSWPAKSEPDKYKEKNSPKPPSGGQHYKELNKDELLSTFQLKF